MIHKPVTLVGSYLSPYVRKVLVCLAVKQIDYVIDPIAPLLDRDEYSRTPRVRPVPVFIDENVTISDSTVICEYLEERYPQPALYPATPQLRARARWLGEYADTRMGEVFIRRMFDERVTKHFVSGEKADAAVVSRAVDKQAPQILDYLEHEFSSHHPFLFGEMGITEISIASFMRNAILAGYEIDAQRWPAMHSVVQSTLQHTAFVALRNYEEISLCNPLVEQREALLSAGAPVSSVPSQSAICQRGLLAG
ncbi:MAG: glutathione S-transferase family protein [Halioglobus sp.]